MSIRPDVDARGFDQRITIQRQYTVKDSTGDPVGTWKPLTVCWAKVDGTNVLRRPEAYLNNSARSVADYTMTIRASVAAKFGIKLTDRVYWNGKVFDIIDMPDQQLRGRLLPLIVKTGINQG